jgi:hypothetical protein
LTIYQTIFEDRNPNSDDKSETIIDFIYVTFLSTFKGLQAMLEKRHIKDPHADLIISGTVDLIRVLQQRHSIAERFRGNGIQSITHTVNAGGGGLYHMDTSKIGGAFKKRIQDMINNLTSINNQMQNAHAAGVSNGVANEGDENGGVKGKTMIANERNFLLSKLKNKAMSKLVES